MSAPKAIQGFQGNLMPFVSCNIGAGGGNSSVLTLNGFVPVGILYQTNVAWTGTALSFKVGRFVDGLFYPAYNKSGLISYPIPGVNQWYLSLNADDFHGAQFMYFQSNGTEAAERDFLVALKGI